jgi:hypothetical protein
MNPIRFPAAPAIRVALVAAGVAISLVWAHPARAQTGTGGATGGGTLADSDMFLSVQKVQGSNLNARDQARFLNRASCKCNSDVWLKAVVLPGAPAAKAQTITSAATVSAFVGYDCANSTLRPNCLPLGSVPISEFRLKGITRKTKVGDLAKYRIQSTSTTTRTCGASGSGGASGTGGAGSGGAGTAGNGGAGGNGGTSGSGGAGTGGATVVTDACDMQAFTQTFWVFIGTAGDGSADLGSATEALLMDVEPPCAPTMADPRPVHQALMVNWTGLATSDAADLLGYQVICTRGETTQVFKANTFTAGFNDICEAGQEIPAVPWPNPVGSFACSALLPASTTSYRVKTLENDVQYQVAVAAIDKQGNASLTTPRYGVPILTEDFYYDYRHGDPQGGAVGGFCAVPAGLPVGLDAAGGVGLVLGLGLAVRAAVRRRARRRG